jgi:hypothetical protein
MSLARPRRLLVAALMLFGCICPGARSAVRGDTPYGIHSMLYVDAPLSFKEAMFRQAAELGASSIRVDVFVPAIVATPDGRPDWTALDEYMTLARRYRLQVLGVLLGTPSWLAACPRGTSLLDIYKCPSSDPRAFAAYAAEIARHARGVIDDWEIRNEPDGRWAYLGTPADYARELTTTAAAIHAANPGARVMNGGAMMLASRGWLDAVFAAAGAALPASLDVVNVHIRGRLSSLYRTVEPWRAFFARHGIHRPLWVTEHGYPSDPAYQGDPAFSAGESSQAAYLARSLPALLHAGAARVFVTERDNLGGPFASEGLLGGSVSDPPTPFPAIRQKPAAAAFAALARGRHPDRALHRH